MNNYTKEQRHEIYKQAYVLFVKEWNNRECIHFICNCLTKIVHSWALQDFPELLNKKTD